MFLRSSFDKEINNSIHCFIELAKAKAREQAITHGEYEYLIENFLALQKAILDKYHNADLDGDQTVLNYLDNFATKLESLANITKNKDNHNGLYSGIQKLVKAATPPSTFSDKAKHVVSLLAGFAGCIVGFICGAVVGGLIGAGIGAGVAYFAAPPLLCQIAVIAGGITAALGGIYGAIKGAKYFYHKTENHIKPPSEIQDNTTQLFKSSEFHRLFSKPKPASKISHTKINVNDESEDTIASKLRPVKYFE